MPIVSAIGDEETRAVHNRYIHNTSKDLSNNIEQLQTSATNDIYKFSIFIVKKNIDKLHNVEGVTRNWNCKIVRYWPTTSNLDSICNKHENTSYAKLEVGLL